MDYNGRVTQTSSPFPLGAFQAVFDLPQHKVLGEYSRFPFPKELASEQLALSLEPWEKLRSKLESGVTFTAHQDAREMGGYVSLVAGSVRKIIKGKLTAIGTQLNSGHFKGDGIQVESKNAFLKDSDFTSLVGSLSLLVQEKAHLQGMTLHGGAGTIVKVGELKAVSSLLESPAGSSQLEVAQVADVHELKMQAKNTSVITADSLQASGLAMTAQQNQLVTHGDAYISGSTFSAGTLIVIKADATLKIASSHAEAEQTHLLGKVVEAQSDAFIGQTLLEAQKEVKIDTLKDSEHVTALAPTIELKGDIPTVSFKAKGHQVTNTAALKVKTTLELEGDIVSQLATTEAETSTIKAEQYVDTEESRNSARKEIFLIAPHFNGTNIAPLVRVQTGMTLQEVLKKTQATRLMADLGDQDVDISQDLTIFPHLYLKAKSARNTAIVISHGDFNAELTSTFVNLGDMTFQGQACIKAIESITNRGTMSANNGLGLWTSGLLTHKGIFAGGKALTLYAHKIDANAEVCLYDVANPFHRSYFIADMMHIQAETDALLQGAYLRGGDGLIEAGYVDLGAPIRTLSSEEARELFLWTKS